jgi:uncharacterized protein (DUF1919 family)
MNNYTFITNNCQGESIYKMLNREYDNPFIGSFIQDDDQYLKFCLNFDHYISQTPRFDKNILPVHQIAQIDKNFPVMFLDDIEIHWIHETSIDELSEKYKRRLDRMNGKTPFFIWGDPLLHRPCSEEQRNNYINMFSQLQNRFYLKKEIVPEYQDKSMDDRIINPGWAQTLKWHNFNISAAYILNSIQYL